MSLAGRWTEGWRADSAILFVGLVVLAPYVVAGPGLFVDDWFALRNVEFGDAWDAAGPDQWRARPGAALVYALAFGVIGARPRVLALVALVLLLATALVLRRVCCRFLAAPVALAISLVWLVVPNHTSLEAWPSALNIATALLLAVAGVERLTKRPTHLGHQVAAVVIFASSVLCYEATAPLIVAAVALVAWRERAERRAVIRLVVIHAVALAAVVVWMVANWHPAKAGIDVWLDPVQVINGHVATGVVGEHLGSALLGGFVMVATAVACYLAAARRDDQGPGWPFQLILAGWAVVAIGAVPFVRYFYSPVGLGDRVTVVSGIGGAMVLVGTVAWVGCRNAAVASVLGVVVAVGAVGHRASLISDYATAASDSRRILAHVEERWPEPPDDTIVFGPYPVMKRNIVAFIDADWPLQWFYKDRSVAAGFTLTPDAFEAFPADQRVDLLELSDLEPTGRLTP